VLACIVIGANQVAPELPELRSIGIQIGPQASSGGVPSAKPEKPAASMRS